MAGQVDMWIDGCAGMVPSQGPLLRLNITFPLDHLLRVQ